MGSSRLVQVKRFILKMSSMGMACCRLQVGCKVVSTRLADGMAVKAMLP